MIGVYIFFLLSSFRGKVEGNWTSPVLVSLIVLSHQFLNEKNRWKEILYKLLPLTMILVLIARIVMIIDVLPVKEIQTRLSYVERLAKRNERKNKGIANRFQQFIPAGI
jgi:hypothetical protein